MGSRDGTNVTETKNNYSPNDWLLVLDTVDAQVSLSGILNMFSEGGVSVRGSN